MDEFDTPRYGSAAVDQDTIRVSTRTGCDVSRAWCALWDTDRLSLWFGDLDTAWQPGRSGRVDFGDGDFFVLTTRNVVEHRLIEFDWGFLGIGPPARIRWSVTSVPCGTEITVTDRQSHRPAAEVDQLLAGWTDFLDRLARFLQTGRCSRYEFRDEIDGGVTLSGDGPPLLGPDRIHDWLPIATDGFGPRWFFIVDDEGPRRFRLTDWRAGPDRVTFSVVIPDAARPTSCVVRVQRTARGWWLSFSHTGWGGLGLPERHARLLRRRFTNTWVATLESARVIADATG